MPPRFPYARWTAQTAELSRRFREAEPFPHLVLPDFLEAKDARALEAEFPRPDATSWIQYRHYNENKLGKSRREEFPPRIGEIIDELNSPPFLQLLGAITGIEGLVADPMLEGGGMHQTERGGFLNMHADFSMHHYQKSWRRRINLILYLNGGWEEQWGGSLELWDREMKSCVARVPPILNQALIFLTERTSFHGYPDAIQCPPGATRKSLALYYYTPETGLAPSRGRSTDYRARPGERRKAPLIWLDKKALHLYSLLKTTFGISDDFVSRMLGALFGRRRP